MDGACQPSPAVSPTRQERSRRRKPLARADAAPYAAKDAGGDRILASSVLVPNKPRAVARAETEVAPPALPGEQYGTEPGTR